MADGEEIGVVAAAVLAVAGAVLLMIYVIIPTALAFAAAGTMIGGFHAIGNYCAAFARNVKPEPLPGDAADDGSPEAPVQ